MSYFLSVLYGILVPKLGWTSLQIPLTIIPPIFIAFFTQYVYDDPSALSVLYLMHILDFITGVAAAKKDGTLTSKKLHLVLVSMVLSTAFLMVSWQFEKHNPNINAIFGIINSTFAGFVYFVLTSQLLLSLAENLSRLGVLPKTLIDFLKDKLDIKKLFKKGKNDE